jgi:cobalt/nickel transport system permease protein
MHIAEGMLSPAVLGVGMAFAAAGVAVGLRRMDAEDTPRVAVMASAFFAASLIHIPVGPTSVHLVLNGLMGLVLGWAAFPAMAVALLLQAIFFGFGGLAVLGVNVCLMATPAVVVHYILRGGLASPSPLRAQFAGAPAGGLAIVGSALLAIAALVLSEQAFAPVAMAVAVGCIPLLLIEAVISAIAVGFLNKVRPEVFRRLTPQPAP